MGVGGGIGGKRGGEQSGRKRKKGRVVFDESVAWRGFRVGLGGHRMWMLGIGHALVC